MPELGSERPTCVWMVERLSPLPGQPPETTGAQDEQSQRRRLRHDSEADVIDDLHLFLDERVVAEAELEPQIDGLSRKGPYVGGVIRVDRNQRVVRCPVAVEKHPPVADRS